MSILSENEFENLIFFLYFLNKDFSVIIQYKLPRFGIHVDESQMEGTVSQFFYLGLSFNFMKSEK